jgi:hypothetical protein
MKRVRGAIRSVGCLSLDDRNNVFLSLTQKGRCDAKPERMKIFGEEKKKQCLLDRFKPSQCPAAN